MIPSPVPSRPNIINENNLSSQSLIFLCSLVSNIAEFLGFLFGFYGIFNFLAGWMSLGSCLIKYSCGGYEGSGNPNKVNNADEMDGVLYSLIVIATILAVAIEMCTSLLFTKVLTKVYYQRIQTHFNLQPNNILLKSTSIFVAGICLFVTLQVFHYLNFTFHTQKLYFVSTESTPAVHNNHTRSYVFDNYFESVEEVELYPRENTRNTWGMDDETEIVSASSSVDNDESEDNSYGYGSYEDLSD